MADKKIRVCYIISSLSNEGPVNVMYNIIRYIDFSRFEVSVITLIPEKDNTRISEFKRLPVKIYQVSPKKYLNPFNLYFALKKKVDEINPDILHSHCPRSLYLMAFLPSRFKSVYTIHIYPGLQQKKLYGAFKGELVIALNNFFTKRCDLPIACSDSVAGRYKIEKNLDIVSIPNGSSLDVWPYNQNDKDKLREELGLDKNLIYFIYIGRFSKEKNPDKLMDVFAKETNSKLRLIMLGSGEMWNDLNKAKSSNVILPGFTTRVYDYLKASDYYISASDVEGLANTLLESMTVGLPMVLSDIPSHHEVLNNFKEETVGIIADQHNEESIKDAIHAILQIDAANVRRAVQDIFQRKYTAKKMSEAYQYHYIMLTKR